MGKKTKIDWCDSTWNPVTGCLHGCEYCYARRIAKRFGSHMQPLFVKYPILHQPVRCSETYDYMHEVGINEGKIQPYPFDFHPAFHRYRLDEPARWTKPRNIFVCSMADLFGDWVPDEWIEEVLSACEKAPQHRYLFLTKNPDRVNRMMIGGYLPNAYTDRYWFGTTWVPESKHLAWGNGIHKTFVSVEPILEPMDQDDLCRISALNWIIVGAETGNRAGKIVPKREWISEIADAARGANKPLFMKNSLRGIMGADFRQEFPWEV